MKAVAKSRKAVARLKPAPKPTIVPKPIAPPVFEPPLSEYYPYTLYVPPNIPEVRKALVNYFSTDRKRKPALPADEVPAKVEAVLRVQFPGLR